MSYCTWTEGDVYAYAGDITGGWYIHTYPTEGASCMTYKCTTLDDFSVMMTELRRRGYKIPDHAFMQIEDQIRLRPPMLVRYMSLNNSPQVLRTTISSSFEWQSHVVLPQE